MNSPFSSRRLPPAQRSQLLRSIVDRVESAARPVVVFDLDGTLLDNRPRTVAIFHELAAVWQDERPDVAAGLQRAHLDVTEYGVSTSLARIGVDAHHDEVFAFWRERFFTDAYIAHDVPLPGAVELVQTLHRHGANIVYLTGRDLPGMALGTFQSLRDHGFPIGRVGTELVTKPDFETPDDQFKRAVAVDLVRLGEVVATFDNEAVNCNLLREAYPGATAVLLDTHFAPDPPPLHPEVRVIDHFERLP